jgi:hypothetical protein
MQLLGGVSPLAGIHMRKQWCVFEGGFTDY